LKPEVIEDHQEVMFRPTFNVLQKKKKRERERERERERMRKKRKERCHGEHSI
jgi:hypothetical protein